MSFFQSPLIVLMIAQIKMSTTICKNSIQTNVFHVSKISEFKTQSNPK